MKKDIVLPLVFLLGLLLGAFAMNLQYQLPNEYGDCLELFQSGMRMTAEYGQSITIGGGGCPYKILIYPADEPVCGK